MKKTLLTILSFVVCAVSFAQDLPTNPEPGKCYVRCVTPDVWVNQDVTIQVAPAYKKLSAVPAKYTTVKEEVVVKAASKKLEIVPAKFETKTFEVVVEEASRRLVKVPAKTSKVTETVVVKAASQRLEVVPAVYETQTFDVVTQAASQRVEVIPAKYETRTENVVCQEKGQRLVVVPAEWGTETITYRKKQFGTSISVVPAKFTSDSQYIEIKPATAKWGMSDTPAADCASSDPNDCRYWCYKAVPAQNITVPVTKLASDASFVRSNLCDDKDSGTDCGMATYTKRVVKRPATTRVVEIPEVVKQVKRRVMVTPPTTRVVNIPEVKKTMKRTVMVKPPTTRTIDIPAVTKTITRTVITPETTRVVDIPQKTKTMERIVMVTPPTTRSIDVPQQTSTVTKTVLAEDAKVIETPVAPISKTITKEVLQTKGGLTTWKEVDCKLVNSYNDLNINWNLGSATLTPAAKAEIDNKLLPVLAEGVSVEIASHTDSRGSKASNRTLSERRAQAVTNYLISKGINASRIVSNGYGESRLTNRCSDGVSCTEREHLANRRTQFRVINSK